MIKILMKVGSIIVTVLFLRIRDGMARDMRTTFLFQLCSSSVVTGIFRVKETLRETILYGMLHGKNVVACQP